MRSSIAQAPLDAAHAIVVADQHWQPRMQQAMPVLPAAAAVSLSKQLVIAAAPSTPLLVHTPSKALVKVTTAARVLPQPVRAPNSVAIIVPAARQMPTCEASVIGIKLAAAVATETNNSTCAVQEPFSACDGGASAATPLAGLQQRFWSWPLLVSSLLLHSRCPLSAVFALMALLLVRNNCSNLGITACPCWPGAATRSSTAHVHRCKKRQVIVSQ